MSQLEADAKPRAAPGSRVKAVSRASGSANALALTRDPSTASVKKGAKKRSTSNTVAEQEPEAPCRRTHKRAAAARRASASFDTGPSGPAQDERG